MTEFSYVPFMFCLKLNDSFVEYTFIRFSWIVRMNNDRIDEGKGKLNRMVRRLNQFRKKSMN